MSHHWCSFFACMSLHGLLESVRYIALVDREPDNDDAYHADVALFLVQARQCELQRR